MRFTYKIGEALLTDERFSSQLKGLLQPVYCHKLGLLFKRSGKDEDALRFFDRAIELLQPGQDLLHFTILANTGHAYLRVGKRKRSKAVLNEFLAIAPYHEDGLFNLLCHDSSYGENENSVEGCLQAENTLKLVKTAGAHWTEEAKRKFIEDMNNDPELKWLRDQGLMLNFTFD